MRNKLEKKLEDNKQRQQAIEKFFRVHGVYLSIALMDLTLEIENVIIEKWIKKHLKKN